jgi:hypothetical protein
MVCFSPRSVASSTRFVTKQLNRFISSTLRLVIPASATEISGRIHVCTCHQIFVEMRQFRGIFSG